MPVHQGVSACHLGEHPAAHALFPQVVPQDLGELLLLVSARYEALPQAGGICVGRRQEPAGGGGQAGAQQERFRYLPMGAEQRVQTDCAWCIVPNLVKPPGAAHVTVLEDRITEQTAGQVGPGQIHAPELGLEKVAVGALGIGHIRANQRSSGKAGAGQIGVGQVCPRQADPRKIGVDQLGAGQVGFRENSTIQVRSRKVGTPEVRAPQIGTVQPGTS